MVKKAALTEILSKLKWSKEYDFTKVRIYYVHRGKANNYEIMLGSEIEDIKGGFFIRIDGTYIPMHRVFLVIYEEEILYKNERKFPPNFNLEEENGSEK